MVKDLHGQKNIYYQVNSTYHSALGEDDRKMLMARALQLFMPGKPQIWYLDLFAGKNDYEPLTAQVTEMKKYPDTFVYEEDFSKGNFHYLLAEGEVHAYEAVYQYLYNFLPYLFR